MLTSVYRSKNKDHMYLYITTKDDFSEVPEKLMKLFGKPEFSMLVNLSKREKLARVELPLVKQALKEQGYYLQMPPVIHENKAN